MSGREYFNLVNDYESKRKAVEGVYPCPCCKHLTFDSVGEYDICPICFWEDDPVQEEKPDLAGGANKVSLVEAEQNFLKFGASEREFLKHCRQPLPAEMPVKPIAK
jgi:hypothetical protein